MFAAGIRVEPTGRDGSGLRMQILGATLALISILASAGPAAATNSAPTIGGTWVTNVTRQNATLHAEINPNGLLTKYKLQIDTTGNFDFFQLDGCPLHPPGIFCTQAIVPGEPLPAGLVEPPEETLPAGTESKEVNVDLASIGAVLQPGTTYHFRAIAANSSGFTYGSDLTFVTPESEVPPTEPPEEDEESTPASIESSGDMGSDEAVAPDAVAAREPAAVGAIARARIRATAHRCRSRSRKIQVVALSASHQCTGLRQARALRH